MHLFAFVVRLQFVQVNFSSTVTIIWLHFLESSISFRKTESRWKCLHSDRWTRCASSQQRRISKPWNLSKRFHQSSLITEAHLRFSAGLLQHNVYFGILLPWQHSLRPKWMHRVHLVRLLEALLLCSGWMTWDLHMKNRCHKLTLTLVQWC